MYDSYGHYELPDQQSFRDLFIESKNFIGKTEFIFYYSIVIILTMVLTFEEGVRTSRKHCLMILFSALLVEFVYISGTRGLEPDILDDIFPNMALYERILLIRLVTGVLITFLRIRYYINDRMSLNYLSKTLPIFTGYFYLI